MAKLPESEVVKLAENFTLQELLDDFLLCQESLSEWTARSARDKSVMQHKMINETLASKTEATEIHGNSGLKVKQYQISLGDYNIVTQERVRSSFDKDYVIKHVELKLINSRTASDSFSVDVAAIEGMTERELRTALMEARQELTRQRVSVLEEVKEVVDGAQTFSKHWDTDPKFTGRK